MLAARNWDRPPLIIWNPVEQYLLETGRTCFKGMQFSALRRLQLDIETDRTSGYSFSHPDRDPILAIALSDSSGWEEVIVVDGGSEAESAALDRLSSIIRTRDPDIIEGHNLFKFDLPYLMTRASKLGVKLSWGRDGSDLFQALDHHGNLRLDSFKAGGGANEFRALRVRGRHIVDTYHLAKARDVITHEFGNCGLKNVARVLGVSDPDRVILEGDEIQRAYREDRARFLAYALADVRDTRGISAVLSPSYFVQAQIYPCNKGRSRFVSRDFPRVRSAPCRESARAGLKSDDKSFLPLLERSNYYFPKVISCFDDPIGDTIPLTAREKTAPSLLNADLPSHWCLICAG